MSNVPAIALAVAAGVYVVTRPQKQPTVGEGRKLPTAILNIRAATPYAPIVGSSSTFANASAARVAPKEVTDAFLAKARAEWANLSSDAKRKACESLKRQYPSNPSVQQMDCTKATFDQIVKVTGAAIAIGACASTGVGASVAALCGPIGAWIGGWAGDKAKQWAADAWSKVSGAGDWVKDQADDAVEYGFNKAGEAIDWLF